jgi:hypothetical protein
MIIRGGRGMRGMGDDGNFAPAPVPQPKGGGKNPVVHFPMGRDWEDTRLLTGETFPPLTTLDPRDPTSYPNYSYARMNQWDGEYQPNTTMGARWSPAYRQFAGMGSSDPRRGYGKKMLNGMGGPASTRGLLTTSNRRTFGMRGMGATNVPGAGYPMSTYRPGGNEFTRIVGDTQFPLFPKAKAYRLAGMGGMGDAVSFVDSLTGGKVTEVQGKLDDIATLLKVSTGAAVLSALVVLIKR